jgi:hypothetical protein
MTKLTQKQLDILCECGHPRREHSDDQDETGMKIIREAVGFCLEIVNGFECHCQEFKKQ